VHGVGERQMVGVIGAVQDARYARAERRRVLDRASVRRPWPVAGSPQATQSSVRIEISSSI
jgi:hypothetical protein